MAALRSVAIGMLLVAALSCSSKSKQTRADQDEEEEESTSSREELPGYLRDAREHPHPDCPPGQFLTGVGSSDESAQHARDRALAAVANKISSSIESELDDVSKLQLKNGNHLSETTLVQRIKQKSRFNHAQLINVVGEVKRYGRNWFAFACLDRQKTQQVLQEEMEPSMRSFLAASSQALAEKEQGRRSRFAVAFREASTSAQTLMPLIAQVRAINDGNEEVVRSRTKFWNDYVALLEAAYDVRRNVSFAMSVRGKGVPEDIQKDILSAVKGALTGMKFSSTVVEGDGSCKSAGDAAYALSINTDAACRWGSLGHTCEPNVSLSATECPSGAKVFDSPFSDARLKGSSARSEDKALRNALKPLTEEAVGKWVRGLLEPELPAL